MKKITTPNDPAHHIAVFQETTIRRVWHNEEWWFAIVDVVGVLTDSADPRQYIKKMRSRDPELDANWGTTCTPLALQAADGKQRETNCANTEGLFRIIQSIPSPKAEPFKRWLAQVGYERVKEIENPELASARARELYQAKGYPQAWSLAFAFGNQFTGQRAPCALAPSARTGTGPPPFHAPKAFCAGISSSN